MKRALVCSQCPAQIGKASKSGLCKACAMRRLHADPEYARRRNEATRKANQLPEARAQRSRTMLKRYADPANRKALGDACRAAFVRDPERGQARRDKAADTLRAFHAKGDFDWSAWHRERLARRARWCPQDLWLAYQALRKQVGAPEAKRMILEDMAHVERVRLVALSPFEREMERLNRGAAIVEVRAVPRSSDPAYTLGGVVDYL